MLQQLQCIRHTGSLFSGKSESPCCNNCSALGILVHYFLANPTPCKLDWQVIKGLISLKLLCQENAIRPDTSTKVCEQTVVKTLWIRGM
jgi:hypothetical protein